MGRKLPGPTPSQPDGLFAEWRWENETLTALNDRYGFSPLFYSCFDNEIRISSSLQEVLRGNVPRDLDYPALAVLLRMGHPVGEDTPFLHVRAVPPGSTLTWFRGRLTIDASDLPVRKGQYSNIAFDDAVDQFAYLFNQAIAKRMPEDDAVEFPLSGGRDSRHILLALHANGFMPRRCVTLEYRPPTTNEDIRVARLLAGSMGLEHVVVNRAFSWFDSVAREVALTNYSGGSHAWILPLADYLRGRTSTLYDGLAGSVLSGGFMTNQKKLSDYREGRLERLAQTLLLEGGREGFIDALLTPAFKHKVDLDVAVERLVAELKRHADAINPMLSFIFWNRTRRGVSQIPLAIMSSIPTVHCPYLDHAVHDFLIGVDPSFFLNNRLHDEVIRRAYPSQSHIPYEEADVQASYRPGDSQYFKRAVKELIFYLARRTFRQSSILMKERLYPRMARDLVRPSGPPWYLIMSMYCSQLEELSPGQ